jgi:hypothetical protein
MTLLLLRAGILAQARGAAPPPDLYVPPSPDSIALDFALDATGAPYVAPASGDVVLEFAVTAPPPAVPPGIYDPPPSDSVTLAFSSGASAYDPPHATAIPLEF